MKKIILSFLIAFSVNINCKAQYYQRGLLVDTEFILTSLVINNTSYNPPITTSFNINNSDNKMKTEVKNWLEGTATFSDVNGSFTVNNLTLSSISCDQSECEFESIYFNFFKENPGNKIFNYQVMELLSDCEKQLFISSGNTTAYYQSKNLGNRKFTNIDFKIYPNPTENFISIIDEYEKLDSAEFEIYDSLGRLCLTETLNQSPINIQNLKKGIYLIRIKKDDTIYTDKFIKN